MLAQYSRVVQLAPLQLIRIYVSKHDQTFTESSRAARCGQVRERHFDRIMNKSLAALPIGRQSYLLGDQANVIK